MILEGMTATVTIEVGKKWYRPGETVRGKVLVSNSRSMSVRSIDIRTLFAEHIFYAGLADPPRYMRSDEFDKQAIQLCREETLPPGTNEFPFAIKLKRTCPPSFDGTLVRVGYELIATVDIPMSPDLETGIALKVRPPRYKSLFRGEDVPLEILSPNARVDQDGVLSTVDGRPALALWLNRRVFRTSGTYDVTLGVAGPLDKIRKATIWTEPVETVHGKRVHYITTNPRLTTRVKLDGLNIVTLKLPLKRDSVPTIKLNNASLRWKIGCDLDIAWAGDIHASGRITVIDDLLRRKVLSVNSGQSSLRIGDGR